MKKYLLSLLFLGFTAFVIAQATQGEVIYEEKRNIHKTLPAEMEAMKANIPEFRTSKHQLLFNSSETSYKKMEKTEEEKAQEQEFRSSRGDGRGRRGPRGGRFGTGGDSNRYTDIQENISLSSTELMGKKFLVKGALSSYPWKMTGESKQVGSFLCQKAIYKDSTENLVAWFTPMIPVKSGPDSYSGLPGLILHLNINDGEKEITAIDIQLKEVVEGVIIRPTEGKPIAEEEFKILRKEKMEERRAEGGGRGRGH